MLILSVLSVYVQVGEKLVLPGGVVLTFLAYEKSGPFDVDSYKLVVTGVAEIAIRLRPANALLRTVEDAEVHFNVGFTSLKVSDRISLLC